MAKAKKKQATKTNRSKKATKQWSFSTEAIAIVLLLCNIVAIFRWGYLGIALTNIVRFMVGDTDRILLSVFIIASIGLLFKALETRISSRLLSACVLAYMTTLLWLHAMQFSQTSLIVEETLQRISVDFFSNQLTQAVGGGMIGALLYTTTRFLVSQWGTYLIIFILYGLVVFLVSNKQLSDVIAFLKEKGQKGATAASDKWSQIKEQRFVQKEEKQTQDDSKRDVAPSLVERMKQMVFEGGEEEVDEVMIQQLEQEDSLDNREHSAWGRTFVDDQREFQDQRRSKYSGKQDAVEQSVEDMQEELDDFEIEAEQEDMDYQLPPLTLLNPPTRADQSGEKQRIKQSIATLEQTFASFGVDVKVMEEPLLGPAVTKFEIKPAVGVKVSKIVNLADDIALALAAKDIRIEAPIPGKPYIGIEVPNTTASSVSFSDVIQASLHSSKLLEVPLGRDISGNVRLADLTKMPHMLIAGSTGSGKSVCINGIITSLLMKTKPNEVKLMMIDPKMVELNVYNGIPHLLTPVVTNPRKAAQALQKVVTEMENRYEKFAAFGMRNIDGYNQHIVQHNLETGENQPTLPYIVVIVDELADLMMVASNEVEDAIIRLAQMARAAGIHMILATQRPSVDVITGIIKANVPSRIAFAVSSGTDSRTIIDSTGAEKLIGRGDMLFLPMGESKPTRVQGAFLTDEEVERVVTFVKEQQAVEYVEEMLLTDDGGATSVDQPEDELFYEVVEMLRDQDTISTSFIQRRFRIGFNRAARLIDELESRGYIGASEGSKPRKVNSEKFEQVVEDDTVDE